jgi:hypothetical protein
MRILSQDELQCVSGAAVIDMDTWKYMDQVLSNVLDGAATGMAIGGKWGGAGGIGFGALSQLVGIIVPAIMGGILGFVSSVTTGYEATGQLLSNYRETFGTA